jgi:hypothetical protein
MTSISASTKHTGAVPSSLKKKTTVAVGKSSKAPTGKKAAAGKRGSIAPAMKPVTLSTPEQVEKLKSLDESEQKTQVMNLCKNAMGEQILLDRSKPHAASTTRERSGAAADVAVAARELGIKFVLKNCEVMAEMQRMLFPEGISKTFRDEGQVVGGLKPSASAVSLDSMCDLLGSLDDLSCDMTTGTDSKRGKSTPANAREGKFFSARLFVLRFVLY